MNILKRGIELVIYLGLENSSNISLNVELWREITSF
jgi:hypothetical protein